jgi:hypothetical protein
MPDDANMAMGDGTGVSSPEVSPMPSETGNTVMLNADMFPDGPPKPGTKLVVGQADEQGNIPCTMEAMPKDGKGDDDDLEKWKGEFRAHMSATAPAEEAA